MMLGREDVDEWNLVEVEDRVCFLEEEDEEGEETLLSDSELLLLLLFCEARGRREADEVEGEEMPPLSDSEESRCAMDGRATGGRESESEDLPRRLRWNNPPPSESEESMREYRSLDGEERASEVLEFKR